MSQGKSETPYGVKVAASSGVGPECPTLGGESSPVAWRCRRLGFTGWKYHDGPRLSRNTDGGYTWEALYLRPEAIDYRAIASENLVELRQYRAERDSARQRVAQLEAELRGMAEELLEAQAQWRCFHCGKVCATAAEARRHFGNIPAAVAACVAKLAVAESDADLAAISWAYRKLLAFGVGSIKAEDAHMLDRLNLMLPGDSLGSDHDTDKTP